MTVNYTQLTSTISAPKLNVYKAPLGYTSNANAVRGYYLLSDISQHLFTPLHLIELALRNITNVALVARTSRNNWYDSIPTQKVSQDHVINAKQAAMKELQGMRVANPDDIVCRLPFGFWVNLYSDIYRDQTSPAFIWDPRTRVAAFPFLPKGLSFKMFHERLNTANQLRNRLFHHEPIWKSKKVLTLSDAIKVVRTRHSELLEILSWIAPESHHLLVACSLEFRWSV